VVSIATLNAGETYMRRREFIAFLFAAWAVLWPIGLAAQGPVRRIGYLTPLSASAGRIYESCLRVALQKLGWMEGQNLKFEYGRFEGNTDRVSGLADELVRLRPDVLIGASTPAAQALQKATREFPVVFVAVSDPVASGIVASLARPGGNVTGVSNFLPATSGKLLELLKQTTPQLVHVAVLRDANNFGKTLEVRELQKAGQTLDIQIDPVELRTPDDIDPAFTAMAKQPPDALVTLQDGVTFANRQRIVDYAAKMKLPAIYQIKEFVQAGGLMSYGLNYCQHFERAAVYVDKILKGSKPSELPVELPTTFELVINLKAAKALGITVPPTLLARADEVIE
jgi:putative tryptophan/tyrosine transport system substrate-binding protein